MTGFDELVILGLSCLASFGFLVSLAVCDNVHDNMHQKKD